MRSTPGRSDRLEPVYRSSDPGSDKVPHEGTGDKRGDNRKLATLKRMFNLARQNGKLTHVPHLPMLKERNVRTGLFERDQIERVLNHLPGFTRHFHEVSYNS
jgi:hypothetical protein